MDRKRGHTKIEPSLSSEIFVAAREAGLDLVGFSRPRRYQETVRFIEERKKAGLFAKLGFTTRDPETSCNPAASLEGVRSIVTCGLSYYSEVPPKPFARAARIASYARRDFYSELRRGLDAVAHVIESYGHAAVVLADSSRLTDRPPSVEAGLGRYGKNSMVITYTLGSWVLFGSVLTTADLEGGSPNEPDCGECRACIVRCPTNAIVADGVIDARKCIAYLLQAPGAIPEEFREHVGDRLYGCDECQICCPLNRRLQVKKKKSSNTTVDLETNTANTAMKNDDFWVDPVWVLNASDEELRNRFGHFYVPRRNFDYLRRNALVVLGNCGSMQDLKVLRPFVESPKALLREHARWAAAKIARRCRGRE